MKEIIKQKIEQSTAANPVTSTELIKIIRRETGESVTARRIRFIIDELRHEGMDIAASKTKRKGYYILKTEADVLDYKRQVEAHAKREFYTHNLVIRNFNAKQNARMPLFAVFGEKI